MENSTPVIRVLAPLHLTQFISLNDEYGHLSENDRRTIASVLEFDEARPLPGDPGVLWKTPPVVEAESGLEFGGASEVFNSLTAGNFFPASREESLAEEGLISSDVHTDFTQRPDLQTRLGEHDRLSFGFQVPPLEIQNLQGPPPVLQGNNFFIHGGEGLPPRPLVHTGLLPEVLGQPLSLTGPPPQERSVQGRPPRPPVYVGPPSVAQGLRGPPPDIRGHHGPPPGHQRQPGLPPQVIDSAGGPQSHQMVAEEVQGPGVRYSPAIHHPGTPPLHIQPGVPPQHVLQQGTPPQILNAGIPPQHIMQQETFPQQMQPRALNIHPGTPPSHIHPGSPPSHIHPGNPPSQIHPGNPPSNIHPGNPPSNIHPGNPPSNIHPGIPPSHIHPGTQPSHTQPGAPPHKILQPGTSPQHIHINNFTANLTYHATGSAPSTSNPGSRPESIGPSPLPRQSVPPFVGYPNPLNYVAPFPPSSPSPPVFASSPYHPVMMLPHGPSLHLSMYPPNSAQQAAYHQQANQRFRHQNIEQVNARFGTPVVSVRRSSSDEETEQIKKSTGDPVETVQATTELCKPTSPTEIEKPDSFATTESSSINGLNDHEVEGFCRQTAKEELVGPSAIVEIETPPVPKLLEDEVVVNRIHHPTPPPFPITGSGEKSDPHAKSGTKSWASLFASSDPSTERIQVDKPMARIPPFSTSNAALSDAAAASYSQESKNLGAHLKNYRLHHVAPSFLPRGLTNRSNWCFVNAILQALLACPTFYNLIKDLPSIVGLKPGKSNTPMMDSLAEFVDSYLPLEAMNRTHRRDKSKKREDLPVGNAFEPNYIYKVLLESETFKVVEGRQEDAEEFLTYLLNILDDEMRALIKLIEQQQQQLQQEEAHESEWHEQAGRGRSCVTRRSRDPTTSTSTPVQHMTAGLVRSSVRMLNSEASATLQPFFTLQLDIQAASVHSLEDALAQNFASEKIEGYLCPRTGLVAEANRTLSLEELPPVLVLHLKRMVYDGTTLGGQKVMKQISFPVDLDINKEILSVNSKTRYSLKQRQYKLFAVVYHNGLEATKGHYVADVYHTGYTSWLRCDDSTVRSVYEQDIFSPVPGSAPYILFYRRGDTMVGVDKSK